MDHAHGATPDDPRLAVQRRRAVFLLALVLVPVAVATIIGLIVLWPRDGSAAARAAAAAAVPPGTTYPLASVIAVTPYDCTPLTTTPGAVPLPTQTCATVVVRIEEGQGSGSAVSIDVPAEVQRSGIGAGDELKLTRSPGTGGAAASLSFNDYARRTPITILALLFAVVVVAVARVRGAAAIVGLAVAFVILLKFMLPAILAGQSPLLIGLVGSSAIMFVVLYLAHGISARTTTALAGTLFGLGLIAGLAVLAGNAARLTGFSNEDTLTLSFFAGQVDPAGIVLCGIIVAGLGVLNDVTITQASAVWQLHELAPTMSPRRLFTAAMAIGRDHIASTVYTIVFAYAGAALPVLLLFEIYQRPALDIITGEAVAEEIVRTLVGAIGLVLAVPVTTLVGVLLVKSVSKGMPAALQR